MCKNAFCKKTRQAALDDGTVSRCHTEAEVFSQQRLTVSSHTLSILKHLSEIQASRWTHVTGETHAAPKCPDLVLYDQCNLQLRLRDTGHTAARGPSHRGFSW